jgi:RNA polymerase sigma-70 factor (ECF subfamily)
MVTQVDPRAETWPGGGSILSNRPRGRPIPRGQSSVKVGFEAFYGQEFRRVYECAFALVGQREAALDATQEAFSRAFARWSRLSKETWAVGWVITTALNLCRRHLRGREDPTSLASRGGISEGPSPDRLDLVNALSRIPLRQREALILHYLGDLPVAVVADRMGTSEGTVKAHLHRGRRALGELMRVRSG